MIEWKQVPWPLWTYSATTVVAAVVVEVETRGPVGAKVLFPLIMLAWLYFLLMGVRWVWIATIGVYVLGFVPDLISGSLAWPGLGFGLVGLVLLLLPGTRHHFSGHADAVQA